MKKKCNICLKIQNDVKFRKNRGKCKKCEYHTRKEYLKQYQKDNYIPYKDLSIDKKQKRLEACKKHYKKTYKSIIKIKKIKEYNKKMYDETKRQNTIFLNKIIIII